MKRQILIFLTCLAIICSGCAMEPKTSGTMATPDPAVVKSDSAKLITELPAKRGPFGKQHRAVQEVEEVFRTVESLRKATQFTAADIRSIATRYSAALVSQCDLEVLKALVASSWVPVVVVKSPVGPKHVRAIVGYDDIAEIVVLTDPVNYAPARIKYSDFLKQWEDPQKSCVLISLRRGIKDRIKTALRKYLTEEKTDSVIIKTSGR